MPDLQPEPDTVGPVCSRNKVKHGGPDKPWPLPDYFLNFHKDGGLLRHMQRGRDTGIGDPTRTQCAGFPETFSGGYPYGYGIYPRDYPRDDHADDRR